MSTWLRKFAEPKTVRSGPGEKKVGQSRPSNRFDVLDGTNTVSEEVVATPAVAPDSFAMGQRGHSSMVPCQPVPVKKPQTRPSWSSVAAKAAVLPEPPVKQQAPVPAAPVKVSKTLPSVPENLWEMPDWGTEEGAEEFYGEPESPEDDLGWVDE